MNSYILESDNITGPWKLVTYLKDFGEQAYFLNFPTKFISSDGKKLWLCYSGNFASGWNNMTIKSNPPESQVPTTSFLPASSPSLQFVFFKLNGYLY